MKKSKNSIKEWLKKYGDPKISKKVDEILKKIAKEHGSIKRK